ncbi:hypothetical protein ABT336_02505 [Micromonospora sp. NPDC000207]|uniref:hypothetical protein n=1 Tax=Micromonospora sp. NPDC000207 TaxID=3154246 RepID=UPI003330F56B
MQHLHALVRAALNLAVREGAIAVVAGVISCVLGFVRSARDLHRLNADVGDCVTGEAKADVRIVDCGDPAALRAGRGRYDSTEPSPS